MKLARLSPIVWACTPVSGVLVVLATTLAGWPSAAQAQSQSGAIEEIIVTSRRIQESIQDVPVAVSAFTPDDIDRIAPRTLRDFDGLMPNVRIGMNTAGPSAGALYIRGIGYADIEKTQSPAVGVIIDGVYQGSNTGQLIDTFDVQQMEVNRGPQGVLQGKNTTGGSIVVTRVRPEFNEWGWVVSGQAGDYSEEQLKGRLNIPLIDDKLALKIAGITKERDGFYDNYNAPCSECVGAIDYDAFTTALRFAPTERFEATLTYDYIKDRGDIPPQDPRWNSEDPFQNGANFDEYQEYDVDALTLNMEWDIGPGTVTSITGWQQADDTVGQDFDGDNRFSPPIPLVQLHTLREQEYEQFSQELKYTWNINDNIRTTFGGFYWDTDLDFAQGTNQILQLPPEAFDPIFGLPPGGVTPGCTIFGGPSPLVPNPNPAIGDSLCQLGPLWADHQASEEVESWAVFGAVDWNITDNIEVSAGARYIEEDKDFQTQFGERVAPAGGPVDELGDPINPPTQPGSNLPECTQPVAINPPCVFPGFPVTGSDSWDDVVFKLSSTWRITDNNMVYAVYSEGFRSGGFSIRGTDPDRLTYEPEDVSNIEVGTKNDLFDGRLRVNVAAFYMELDKPQASSILNQAASPGTNTLILNGNELQSYGLEVEATWAVTDSFSLIANVGLQDVENQESTQSCQDVVWNQLEGTACNADQNPDDYPDAVRSFDKQMGFLATDWNYAVSAVFDREIGPGRFTAAVTAKVTDDVWIAGTPGAEVIEEGYTLWDARVAYDWQLANNDIIRFAVIGKNLGDEEYKEQELPLGATGGFRGWGAPRQYAAEISWMH